MSEQTKIEWATHTFNPWIGCTKVSPGCLNCYAEVSTPARVLRKRENETWGKGAPRQRTSAATWRNPVAWNRRHAELLAVAETMGMGVERARVFPSLCDWLDEEVPIEWLADFLRLIHDTPNLDWLLLTKRPENFHKRIRAVLESECDEESDFMKTWMVKMDGSPGWALSAAAWAGTIKGLKVEPPANVWIGTSVEDQKRADERLPELLTIPAAVRFLSGEPLLGLVDLNAHFGLLPGNTWADCVCEEIDPSDKPCMVCACKAEAAQERIGWVIVGGESGPGARPCNVEWIRSIVRQCKAAGVPCFVKQLGRWILDDGKSTARAQGFALERSWLLDDGATFFPPILGENAFKRPPRAVGLSLPHAKGGDPAEWPEDLRVRQFPDFAIRNPHSAIT